MAVSLLKGGAFALSHVLLLLLPLLLLLSRMLG